MRTVRWWWAGLAALVLTSGFAPAAEGVLELTPEDAALAFAVKNVAELRAKGDKLVEASQLKLEKRDRPSALFEKMYEGLGLKNGVDDKGSAAIVLPSLPRIGVKTNDNPGFGELLEIIAHLVYVVPFDDREAILKNYDLQAKDVVDGKPVKPKKVPDDVFDGKRMVVATRGKHLYVSFREKALTTLLESKSIGDALNPTQRDVMAKADIALLFGFKGWGAIGETLQKNMKENLANPKDDSDNEVMRQFAGLLGDARFIVAGLTIDDGFNLNMIAAFPKDGGATKFLEVLRGGPGVSDLVGLPDVEPLFAYAAKGDGTRNVAAARGLLKLLLDKWLGIEVRLGKEERAKFLTAFDKVYQDLKGSRAVVYRTGEKEAEKIGAMGAIAVLDVGDGDAHLDRWPALLEVVNAIGPKLAKEGRENVPKFVYKPKAEVIDGARVDHLILELPKLPDAVKDGYRKTLGPDWNTVRLVSVGKQVVLFVGSDKDRLSETIKNLKTGAKGLAARKSVATALAKLSAERKLEFHIDVKEYETLSLGKPVKNAGEGLTSFALTLETERIQLEVKTPLTEVRAIVRLLGMAAN